LTNGIERRSGRPRARTRWLLVIAYVALIFALSAIPGLQVPGTFEYRDKLAHVLEYGGLGWLAGQAAAGPWPGARKPLRAVLVALAASALGAADERFQAGVPGRESSAYDWMADSVGASLAQAWCAARAKRGEGV